MGILTPKMKPRQCDFKGFVGRGCGSPYTAFIRRHYNTIITIGVGRERRYVPC